MREREKHISVLLWPVLLPRWCGECACVSLSPPPKPFSSHFFLLITVCARARPGLVRYTSLAALRCSGGTSKRRLEEKQKTRSPDIKNLTESAGGDSGATVTTGRWRRCEQCAVCRLPPRAKRAPVNKKCNHRWAHKKGPPPPSPIHTVKFARPPQHTHGRHITGCFALFLFYFATIYLHSHTHVVAS